MEELGPTSDRELLQRFCRGDRDAFTLLYRAHFPAVFRLVLYMTGDRLQAAEITQDTFVWLVHHPRDFDPNRGELAAFLNGVARKMILRHKRLERRWMPLVETAAAEELASGLEHRQNVQELRKAIAALPERYREAVLLCDLEEKSYEQAADQMACPVGTVRSRLHRARELLARKFLGKKEGQIC